MNIGKLAINAIFNPKNYFKKYERINKKIKL